MEGELLLGVISFYDMAQAIAALQAAVALEEAQRAQAVQKALEQGHAPAPAPAVSLRQRSLPFIQMAQRCQAAQKEIVWGV
jgi:hypothetical protein